MAERRKLRFKSIDECTAEIERIHRAVDEGRLQVTGNWTASQIMNHLAAWIEYGYVGFPIKAPPFFIKWFLVVMGKKIIRDGMRPGVRIPGVNGGTTGADDGDFNEATDRLLLAFKRLKDGEEAVYDSPAFGKMSHSDRIELNLRHAELHLGYTRY